MSETTEAKPQAIPSRQLVLHVMLSLLASAAVFVVVSWLVLVPQLAQHEKRIRELETTVAELQEQAGQAPEPEAQQAQPPPPAAAAVGK